MKTIILRGIRLDLDEEETMLPMKVSVVLNVKKEHINGLDIIKKAIDARRNRPPHFVYALKILLSSNVKIPQTLNPGLQLSAIECEQEMPGLSKISAPEFPVIVIGSGPAGLFAAYILARRGIPALIFERGEPVETRVKSVERFWQEGILDIQSNVFFGEGGAGTFSDGKLTSRSGNPYSSWVKKILVEAGAPHDILIEAKPHVGTDQLRKVIINLRKKLIEMGCKIAFKTQVTDFSIDKLGIYAVQINNESEIRTNHVILAIGQNADDTYKKLYERGVPMEAKPFAMGLRIEHPQELINSIQYGKWRHHTQLPPAEYFLKTSLPDLTRSVYTFCMCPGGSVIGCSASAGSLITNGMSNFRRSGEYANSAIVVNVSPDDFASGKYPLEGLNFRQIWERKAFTAGGGDYRAPVQKTIDFIKDKAGSRKIRTSFLPGVNPSDLGPVLPDFVVKALRRGIGEFDRKMSGFITEESHLIGVETRTSSPVRICRDIDGQSRGIHGLYPCGEGAGYAGGIISSALDGIKAAQNLINHID